MLADKHRRRGGDDDLVAGERGERGGAKCDFGLAIADIADDQPVHRLAASEIGAHRRNRAAPDRRSR
jgi:hypothetical protein